MQEGVASLWNIMGREQVCLWTHVGNIQYECESVPPYSLFDFTWPGASQVHDIIWCYVIWWYVMLYGMKWYYVPLHAYITKTNRMSLCISKWLYIYNLYIYIIYRMYYIIMSTQTVLYVGLPHYCPKPVHYGTLWNNPPERLFPPPCSRCSL